MRNLSFFRVYQIFLSTQDFGFFLVLHIYKLSKLEIGIQYTICSDRGFFFLFKAFMSLKF